MNFWKKVWPIMLGLIGLLLIIGVVLDWDWRVILYIRAQ